MIINTLTDVPFDDVFAAFKEAFLDYERNWTNTEFEKMLHRRGYVAQLSFGAFDGSRLVSFTLNGIGQHNDVRTAYDTGTGTIPAYRGKGLATKIFQESMPYLQQAGISQYLLEVLQHNEKAISMYTHLGFRKEREFNYFIQEKDEVQLNSNGMSNEYIMQEVQLLPLQMMSMWDFQPSWQNSFEAIARKSDDFKILGVTYKNALIGYGIIEPASGDIAQLAVHKDHRKSGIGAQLLKKLSGFNEAGILKIVNTDRKNEEFTVFLNRHNIPISGTQFEMIKDVM
jgi:ribosomal protein S18 acetylase RimI-like enzyme